MIKTIVGVIAGTVLSLALAFLLFWNFTDNDGKKHYGLFYEVDKQHVIFEQRIEELESKVASLEKRTGVLKQEDVVLCQRVTKLEMATSQPGK